MGSKRKLVIVGASAFAEIAHEYFTHDSDYEVVAFSVERAFLQTDRLCGVPVTPFEVLEEAFSPQEHDVFVAVAYAQLNRLRTRLCQQARQKGFSLATYVSSKAFVWKNVTIGENCFIFEHNVVQPFVRIGHNVILWSGNHIGHHTCIKDNCFISSHVVVSGFVTIGDNCFLGVNSTISNNVSVGKDCWIGPGILITKDTPEGKFYKPNKDKPEEISTRAFLRLPCRS